MSNTRFREDGRAFAAKRAYEVMLGVAKKLQLKHAFVFPTGNSACIATKIDRVYCVIPHAVTRPAAYDRINVTQYELEYHDDSILQRLLQDIQKLYPSAGP